MQDHPKLTTAAVIAIAATVVLFLYFLSTRPASVGSSTQPLYAHGNSGPVIPAESMGIVTGAPAEGIRGTDFQSLLSEELKGGATLEAVLFTDLSGDGTEEAVVLIRGPGESRPLDWRLYGDSAGITELLYDRSSVAQGEVEVQGPRLIESEGMFADGDEPCCPSAIKSTVYVWKGGGLVVSRVESAPPRP